MLSHKKLKEVLKNWGLENEKHISVSLAIESVGLSTATPIKTTAGEYI